MAYQGIAEAIAAVMVEVNASGLLSATCTIQRLIPTYAADGQPDLTGTGYSNLVGHVDIACMSAVPSLGNIQATEIKALQDILAIQFRHVLLSGYYPDILPDDRILITLQGITGTTVFDILGVESDSQNQMTRLHTQLAVL